MKIKTRLSLFLEHSFLMLFSATAKKRRPKTKTGKILIARTDGVGDYILWLSVEKQIKSLYPGARIEMLFDERKPTPELAQYDACLDSCLSLPIVTWKRFFSVLAMCRRTYDVILQPVYSRLAMTDVLLFAAKAHKRITLDTNGQYMTRSELKWSNRGYDQIIQVSKEPKHELERCAELLRGLGIRDACACLPDLSCLQIQTQKLADDYIMVFPSASWSAKIWEKEKFADVLRWLLRTYAGNIYLCGDRNDREICHWIEHSVNVPQRLRSLAGKINLAQLTAYIKGAKAVFGNDTGALHIAAACRIPAAVIVAEREIGRFFPYQVNDAEAHSYSPICVHCAGISCSGCAQKGWRECRRQNQAQVLPCIQKISKEQVMKALGRIL